MYAWPFILSSPMDLEQRSPTPPSGHTRSIAEAAFWRVEELQLDALVKRYCRGGGLLEANALAWRMRERCDQPISRLARWILRRDIVVVTGQGVLLVPLFQFDTATGEVLEVVRQTLGELNGAFDDREIARWFVEPNCWIDDHCPLDLIRSGPAAVFEAARTDRFIARG